MAVDEKNIMVLTDCSHGALDAGRFAVKYLFDNKSKIILLQTYHTPVQNKNVLDTISPMLEKVARRELNELKEKLNLEYEISQDKIEIRVIEGELKDIIIKEFGNLKNFSIVAGSVTESSPNKIPCKNIIEALVRSNIYPVFLISDCITLIEQSRILIIVDNENKIPDQYKDYLQDIGEGKPVEIITENNHKHVAMTPESFSHFSSAMDKNRDNLESNDRLFYERVFTVSHESDNK